VFLEKTFQQVFKKLLQSVEREGLLPSIEEATVGT